MKGITSKLSEVDFCVKCVEVLRKKNKPNKADGKTSKGIHVVFSGFNAAANADFPAAKASVRRKGVMVEVKGAQAVSHIAEVAGAVKVVPCRMGAMMYLATDAPERADTKAEDVLDAIK